MLRRLAAEGFGSIAFFWLAERALGALTGLLDRCELVDRLKLVELSGLRRCHHRGLAARALHQLQVLPLLGFIDEAV